MEDHVEKHRLAEHDMPGKHVLQQCGYPHHPILIAIDGSGHKTKEEVKASAALVLFKYTFDKSNWEDYIVEPVYVRAVPLPQAYGTDDTCNNVAEEVAMLLVMQTLPLGYPFLVVNDSLSARSRFLKLRNRQQLSNRALVRRVIGRVTKTHSVQQLEQHEAHQDTQQGKWERAENELRQVQKKLDRIFGTQDDNWKTLYEDRHDTMISIKVDSHQLDTSFNSAGRYEKITPCMALVSANQWADNMTQLVSGTLAIRGQHKELPGITFPAAIHDPPA